MRKKWLYVVAGAILLAACDAKDSTLINKTEHPNHGRITLITDWSGRGAGIDIPDSYHVRVNGNEAARLTFTEHTNEYPELFTPGSHRLHLYHDAEGITVSGNMVSVHSDSRAGGILSSPDWFFSATMNLEIEADNVYMVTATMKQQIRQFTLIIEPTGDMKDDIERITGTLSGVAGTLNLDNSAHGSPSDVVMAFTKITTGANAGKWSATARLLGTADDAQQRLTGMIDFAGGTPASVPFDSDLTMVLGGFNNDKRTPLTLVGQTIETPTIPPVIPPVIPPDPPIGTSFVVTITDWTVVNKEGVIANEYE